MSPEEPTTGLDASCALMLGQVLAKLAEAQEKSLMLKTDLESLQSSFSSFEIPPRPLHQGGRLLICSMHQPRHELMRLFDTRLRRQTALSVMTDWIWDKKRATS